jgi:hypothetical protein
MVKFVIKTRSGKKYTFKGTPADKMRRALKPGRRVSKNGKVYYEYRPSHADYSRKDRY